MTPQQTLEKIIEKAVKNGYCPTDSGGMVANISADSEHGCWFYEEDGTGAYWELTHIIFYDSSFAKAYFGEKMICTSCEKEIGEQDYFEHVGDYESCTVDYECWHIQPAWMEHIQRLALTLPEERLSYLAKYL